jgi:hypothetical protein
VQLLLLQSHILDALQAVYKSLDKIVFGYKKRWKKALLSENNHLNPVRIQFFPT